MLKKTMLATAAMAVLAFAALPSLASVRPHVVFNDEERHFTVAGGPSAPTGATQFNCQETTGTGEFETGKTGWLEITYHGCTEESLGSKCGTATASSGVIETTKLFFHLETIKGKETVPAILITPNNETEVFAHFKCAGGFLNVTWTGSGLIGTITDNYEETDDDFNIVFSGTESIQDHLELDHLEGQWDLHSSVNGGEAETFALDAEITATFTDGAEATLEKTLTPEC